RCFNDCITDFTSKSLGSKEETCLNRCVAKFLNSTDRVGTRFAELYVAHLDPG
ncbi:Tim10/DDP family zinc finger protein, partial [Tirmania nivea]